MAGSKLTRRRLLATGSAAVAALAAACQSQAVPVPTRAPQAAATPAATAPPAATTAPAAAGTPAAPAAATAATKPTVVAPTQPTVAAPAAAAVGPMPRAETLIMSVSDTFNQFQDAALANPFLRGQQRTGWHFMFEPLFYYNPYWSRAVTWPAGLPGKEAEIPWLAESYAYNQDNTELVIKLRPGVTWSDGKPFTAADVVFTIAMLQQNSPDLLYAFDMKTWVKQVTAPDPLTVKIVLTRPNPQFMARYFQWFQDLGFPIVPEHIFKDQDQKTFANLDLAKGWPVTTGPWRLVSSTADQKLFDRRDDWWGARTGFRPLPKMKRVVILPRFEDAKKIQLHAGNEVDATHDMFPANIPALLGRTNKVIFWTVDNKPPYGSVSPSTIQMGFNCARPPFSDPEIRRAINHALDRKQISDVVYKGTGEVSVLPFALLPTMTPFADALESTLKRYPVDAPDPARTAEILERKGWKKDAEGFWAKDGQRFPMVVLLSPGFFQDIGPVIVTQLRRAGFDASFKSPTNFSTLVPQGDADAYIQFTTAGVRDPYLTLDMYHSRYAADTGQAAAQPFRWKNADFDKAVDALAHLQPTDAAFRDNYLAAMEIWLAELPSLPTVKWYLRVPFNTTYWTGWPTEANPYVGGGSWHRGAAGLLIHAVTPAR